MKLEKDLSVFVGNKIREFRKKKKLTQKELGDLIGKKFNTVSNYETGTISPEQDALFALAKALDVSVDDFFPPLSDNSEKSLDRVIELSDDELDLADLDFIKKLIQEAKTLQGDERKRFWDNIGLAVEFFNKKDK